MESLIALVMPLIVATITVPLYGKLKNFVAFLDTAPASIHQILVLFIAALITWLSGLLGVALPTDLAMWTPETTEMALSAGMAYALHAGKKAKKD